MTVTLTGTDTNGDPVAESATTAADGLFAFTGLLAGTYTLTQSRPSTYLSGTDSSGGFGGTVGTDTLSVIPVGAGVTGSGYLFADLAPSSIAGSVFVDVNNDGLQEAGDSGVGGVVITLGGTDDQGQNLSLTTTTASDGSYSFTGLRPGTYTLTETSPTGSLSGKDMAGSLEEPLATTRSPRFRWSRVTLPVDTRSQCCRRTHSPDLFTWMETTTVSRMERNQALRALLFP